MSLITYKGRNYSIRRPPAAVAWGFKGAGPRPQLVLILRKKGETGPQAISRVGRKWPTVNFTAFNEGSPFDASSDFGVELSSPDELVFDMVEMGKDEIAFDYRERESAQGLGSSTLDDEEALKRMLGGTTRKQA